MEQHGLIIKASRSPALASLVRILGDFDLAEEAIQEACYRAVVDWTRHKLPDNPVAWLVQTGRRFAMDMLRHQQMAKRRLQQNGGSTEVGWSPGIESMASALHQQDDQLRLIYTCCHPVLTLEARVALTLKTVAGFEAEEIARAFLLPVSTLQRRLQRAKDKIRDAGIGYEIPGDDQIEPRLEAVLRVIYLIFNQAYTTVKSHKLLDTELAEAAIYLARILNRLVRNEPEVTGLLALFLLQHARAAARTDETGMPVPLDLQDRTRWNAKLIAEANVLLEKCDRHWKPGPYQIQAGIAAIHGNAANPAQTDWQAIVDLYDLLEAHAPGPVVTLNRAIAVAGLRGAAQGLALLEPLAADRKMNNFQYFHSARAGLYEKIGDYAAAGKAFEQAISLSQNDAERRFMMLKLRQLSRQ